MGRTPEAEEAVGIGISVEVERLDLVDPGGDQTMNDIGFQIEMRLAGRAGDEEALIVSVRVEETRAEGLVDLIGGLRDARPDAGGSSSLGLGEDLAELTYHEARKLVLDRLDDAYLPKILERADGVMARAAELAGVARPSFYRMMERLRGQKKEEGDE